MTISGTIARPNLSRNVIAASTGLALWSALTFAVQHGADMPISVKARVPQIVALRVHHDQCPVCKKLKADPEFPKISTLSNLGDVLFVTLDMTSEETQSQSALLVGALGLEAFWPVDLSTLGTVTLVDWKRKRTLSSVRAFDVKAIRSAVREALALVEVERKGE